jgi:hypothetical protein
MNRANRSEFGWERSGTRRDHAETFSLMAAHVSSTAKLATASIPRSLARLQMMSRLRSVSIPEISLRVSHPDDRTGFQERPQQADPGLEFVHTSNE